MSFTEGPRIDLGKPENFNPGPGSYFLKTWKKGPYKANPKNLELR